MPDPAEYVRYHGNANDDVYEHVILHPCPRCHVEMGDFCINPINHERSHIPCVKRLALATFPPGFGEITDDVPPADEEDEAWYV